MAMSDSVTVSMGEETSGSFSLMFLVRLDDSSTASAGKSMYPGRMMMSLERRPTAHGLGISVPHFRHDFC